MCGEVGSGYIIDMFLQRLYILKIETPLKTLIHITKHIRLIEGWTEGVLQMKEKERAWLHVPAAKGYGASPMGSKGGAFYIPANSNLLFDIEILGKEGQDL